MIRGENILCFGPGDWWHMNPSCAKHIMTHLSRENRVLYINPFSSDLPQRASKGFGKRVFRKLRSTAFAFRKASENLATYSPTFFPMQGNPTVDLANNFSVRNQIRCVSRFIGMKPTLLWLENPRAADALDWFSDLPSIYHVSDAFAECPYARNRDALRRRELRLTVECDKLICVSEELYNAKAAIRNGSVSYLPHGVDYDAFAAAGARRAHVPDLDGLKRPLAGYFGTLTAQNDIELLEFCALGAPDISFVYAGAVTAGDYTRLTALPNVRFLGHLPYSKIPALAAAFDVCMLPWRATAWIQHCNPLKFLEYMASGRPIVSVPIRQVMNLGGDLVSVSATKEEFVQALRNEITRDNPDRAVKRQQIASQHSWDAHVEKLSGLIEPALRRKSNGC